MNSRYDFNVKIFPWVGVLKQSSTVGGTHSGGSGNARRQSLVGRNKGLLLDSSLLPAHCDRMSSSQPHPAALLPWHSASPWA